MAGIVKELKVDQILNYYDNPRHETGTSERDTLQKLFNSVGMQYMFNLAEDIQKNGLLRNQQLVVVFSNELNKYVVYDGNRRLAVIKLLLNPEKFDFLDAVYIDRAKKIAKKGAPIQTINCYVTDEEEAFFIMERIHSGEDLGRGIKAWSSMEKSKFKVRRNQPKIISYLIVTYAKTYFNGLDITTILPYTTLQRIFNNKRVKKTIGIDVTDENTFTLNRMMIIKDASYWIKEESVNSGISVTRLFNTAEVIEEKLIPWIKSYKEKNADAKETKSILLTEEDYTSREVINSTDSLIKQQKNNEVNEKDQMLAIGKISKKTNRGISFTQEDIATLNLIYHKNDLSAKIYQLAYEISTLDIKKYHCSICGLYRALIECAVRYYYKESEGRLSYKENSLESNVVNVLNEMGQIKGMNKLVGMWRETITKRKLIDTLNQYMHNDNIIDIDYIEQTWKTMKSFIIHCLY